MTGIPKIIFGALLLGLAGSASAQTAQTALEKQLAGTGGQAMAYVGPTADWNEAFFLISGDSVPQVAEPTPKKITLSTYGEPDRTVTANLLTIKGEKVGEATAMILFSLPSVEAGLEVMQDVEGVRVTMDKQQVFSLSWKDGHAARDQMRVCLVGKIS